MYDGLIFSRRSSSLWNLVVAAIQPINLEPEVWQDGLSCNWHHDESFYTEQTVLRTEWQSGKEDGYVKWYFGDELIYQITADMLHQKPGAADAIPQIPFEAMYLILNTDVSPRWGWNGCDPNNACMAATGMCSPSGELTCLDCSNPDCLRCPDTTAWFADFCQDIHPERPAEYKIDFVRVYQDLQDPTHTLGCDPPEYPTKDLIDENWQAFTFNSWINKEPLQTVQHGGASCLTDADCGKITATEQILANFHSSSNSANGGPDKDAALTGNELDELVSQLSAVPNRNSVCFEGQCLCPDLEWTGPACHSPCVGDYAWCRSTPAPQQRSSAPPRRVVVVPSMILLSLGSWALSSCWSWL